MSNFLDDESPRDRERFQEGIETQGGLTPPDPAGRLYARSGAGSLPWSARVLVPVVATAAAIGPGQQVLTVNGREGLARRWCVQVRPNPSADPVAVPLAPAALANFLRIEWSAGQAAAVADVDLPAGGAAFEIYAQALTLRYAHIDPTDPAPAPIDVSATVCPILGGQSSAPGMFATRTRVVAVPAVPAVAVFVPIPRFAVAVAWVLPPVAVALGAFGAFAVLYLDRNQVIIFNGQATLDWQQLPNGVSGLSVLTNPTGVATTLAAIFRLAL